jgi:hypothetical protein
VIELEGEDENGAILLHRPQSSSFPGLPLVVVGDLSSVALAEEDDAVDGVNSSTNHCKCAMGRRP